MLSANLSKLTAKEQADPFSNYKMGDLVEKCEIVRSGKNGLLVRFPVKSESTEVEEDTHQYGFVSLRNLSEGKEVVSDVRAEFPLGAKKAVRIFQYDYTDGIFICSMQKTMLKQSVMKIEQLVPGDKVTAVIQRLEKKGETRLKEFRDHDHPLTNLRRSF